MKALLLSSSFPYPVDVGRKVTPKEVFTNQFIKQ